MRKFSIFIFFLFYNLLASASVNQDMIAEANNAYTQNKFNIAIELYEKVIKSGYESAELFYNLGNACFKTNNYPSALLYFEKARKLDPSNEKINYNINITNTKIIDKIEELPQPFYRRWWADFREWFAIDVWAVLSVVFLFTFFVSISVYLIGNSVSIRKIFFWFGIIFLAISLVSGINAYSQYRNFQISKEAIIFEPVVNVKSSPDAESQDIFVIHDGTKVKITDKVGTWIEIRIANGSDGWIPETAVEII